MVGVELPPGITNPAEEVVMYAHGERQMMPDFHRYQEISHESLLSLMHQLGCNDKGDWVKGILQPSLSNTSCLMFNFNENSRQTGWPYNWKGSATKEDRNRKHILKAYVFLVLPGGMLRVLNWISSTPFTLSSYRRCNTTPTSRTNKYIEVIPTEIKDKNAVEVPPISVKETLARKRGRVSPPELLNEINSAG